MKLVLTADGSHTIWAPGINEHYHSAFGAVTESRHVFIRSGLDMLLPVRKNVTVFEAGFGTGLNAYLTCLRAAETGNNIHYYGIENDPVPNDLVEMLNYTANQPDAGLFSRLHKCNWNTDCAVHENFILHKIHADLRNYQPSFKTDIVYFDAFSPEKQPDIWTPAIFGILYESMNPGGILTTYCVKGSVKRMLKYCGFKIEKIPGPPGKREILRAFKEPAIRDHGTGN